MKYIFLNIAFILFSVSVFAQAPNNFNYQGLARNTSGQALINQNIGLQISILDATATGALLYKETFSVQTDNNGLFNIFVGNGVVINGSFSAINWAVNSKFLKVEMDALGGTNYILMGTNQLLSVPYALHASNGSKWNTNANNISYMNGNVGIGFNSPIAKLQLNGHLLIHKRNQKLLFGDGVNSTLDSAVSIYRPNGDDGLQITSRGLYVTTSFATAPIVFNYRTIETAAPQTRFVFNMQLMRFGIGTDIPKSSIHVATGDVYLSDSSNGVILTSPNGQCYRVTVGNTGTLVNTLITCP